MQSFDQGCTALCSALASAVEKAQLTQFVESSSVGEGVCSGCAAEK